LLTNNCQLQGYNMTRVSAHLRQRHLHTMHVILIDFPEFPETLTSLLNIPHDGICSSISSVNNGEREKLTEFDKNCIYDMHTVLFKFYLKSKILLPSVRENNWNFNRIAFSIVTMLT